MAFCLITLGATCALVLIAFGLEPIIEPLVEKWYEKQEEKVVKEKNEERQSAILAALRDRTAAFNAMSEIADEDFVRRGLKINKRNEENENDDQ